ncbi:hypothetical protein EPUS_05048 [Endocarpon pusillum Z07020]|uniref:NYN domain-containing protein n=1 Tax=Endocarpon pusillum (strain Z07020 / HMAS-L-300199) TaxID=1263415 RepID=U1G6G7_ENDPU|nr:uncharacterized protein EPUS_05048 [Endocarpon pusillum Z07020]ERF72967.1 hypothetical protein EPUS_05048 [Endocarpon pusillum Z07020]
MQSPSETLAWDLSPAIDLLKTLSHCEPKNSISTTPRPPERSAFSDPPLVLSQADDEELSLGNFSRIWEYLSLPRNGGNADEGKSFEQDAERVAKEVRWRDEVSGADLEDNVDSTYVASTRTRKRAARRSRAKQRAEKATSTQINSYENGSDSASFNEDDSGEELRRLCRSPDRRAVIQEILQRSSKDAVDLPSPPTSPSPPKQSLRVLKKDWPISNPFQWSASTNSGSSRSQLLPLGGLSQEQRRSKLIARLAERYPSEGKYLKNKGLIHPEFIPLNTSDIGVHVFVDISNIMIGFHDCLKLSRDIPVSTRVRRVPMSFHSLSLVLERGRPAAKRVLVGSDKFPTIQQAGRIGYEVNVLERVRKAKDVTGRAKTNHNKGGMSAPSSGSETPGGPEKWVEQAVDEILHLKILESLIDGDRPSTIVLGTGDGKRSEYGDGFMKMVERALNRGWAVELCSFKMNTSGVYQHKEFRARWGDMFQWVQLDDFVEDLVDDQDN